MLQFEQHVGTQPIFVSKFFRLNVLDEQREGRG